MSDAHKVGAVRGTALFVAAIIGPGILTLPALAAAQAGPASLIPLALLLGISAPIAFTFTALHRVAPDAEGIAGYAAAAFGPFAGRLVSAWFLYGVPIGVPALGLIGGHYVAEAFGGGKATTTIVAVLVCAIAVTSTILHRAGNGPVTLILTIVLVVLVVATAVVAAPHARPANLTPFAPHGVVAVVASTLLLTWVLTGWEAVTNFTGVLRDPARTLPRVTAITLIIVAVLYACVAVPEILVLGGDAGGTQAPVAAMLRIAVGPVGAIAAAIIAVVVALGNSLAYVGSLAELGAARAKAAHPNVEPARGRVLVIPVLIIVAGLIAVTVLPIGTETLVSICAGSQVPVYVLGLAAAVKLLPRFGGWWWLAVVSTAAVAVLLVPAGLYLLVPAVIAVVLFLLRGRRRVPAVD